jgi:hypothetical protein
VQHVGQCGIGFHGTRIYSSAVLDKQADIHGLDSGKVRQMSKNHHTVIGKKLGAANLPWTDE